MYKLVASLSIIIRGTCLPNPFAQHPSGEAINWVVGVILGPVTFAIVGLFYRRGSMPALGSVWYLFFYFVHTVLIVLWGKLGFSVMGMVLVLVLYAVALVWLVGLVNKVHLDMYR